MRHIPQVASAQPALQVRGLTKRFGARDAAHGVSFTARAGSVTALLGPNGAGKSTTISCATGLLEPDSGEVRLLGSDPLRFDAQQRSRIGVMLQDGGLTPGATPAQLLAYASRMFRNPRNATELSTLLDIDDFSDTLVRRLSGGQRQRLSLALALMGKPDVLFLDEPTAGMDAGVRRRTRDLIREEAARGAAVVLTTHAIDDVIELADHTIVMSRGEVLADGTPADVIASMGGARAESTVRFSASDPARLEQFVASVRALATDEGIEVTDVTEARTLEDILADLSAEARDNHVVSNGDTA